MYVHGKSMSNTAHCRQQAVHRHHVTASSPNALNRDVGDMHTCWTAAVAYEVCICMMIRVKGVASALSLLGCPVGLQPVPDQDISNITNLLPICTAHEDI